MHGPRVGRDQQIKFAQKADQSGQIETAAQVGMGDAGQARGLRSRGLFGRAAQKDGMKAPAHEPGGQFAPEGGVGALGLFAGAHEQTHPARAPGGAGFGPQAAAQAVGVEFGEQIQAVEVRPVKTIVPVVLHQRGAVQVPGPDDALHAVPLHAARAEFGPQFSGQPGRFGPVAEIDHPVEAGPAQRGGAGRREHHRRGQGQQGFIKRRLGRHPQRTVGFQTAQPGEQRKAEHQIAHALELNDQIGRLGHLILRPGSGGGTGGRGVDGR